MQTVYPRWRGEHKTFTASASDPAGLSPLARGTLSKNVSVIVAARFIPAGAGNTAASIAGLVTGSVYPRWRGEHSNTRTEEASGAGLSPLARGTPSIRRIQERDQRFIPAGAGNTNTGSMAPLLNSVYPRWRGEHCLFTTSGSVVSGLSPLARGTLAHKVAELQRLRFIPAGAGNTLKIYYCFIIAF